MELKTTTSGRTGLWARWRPRTWRDWLAIVGGVLLAGCVCAWLLARATPRWYQPLDSDADWVIDAADVAQKKFLALRNNIERVPLGEQSWSITQDEINGFLAAQFADPLNADGTHSPAPGGPPEVSGPVVVFTPDRVTVAARTPKLPGSDPRGGVGSIVFSVATVRGADGRPMGLVKVAGIWAGCLPVPRPLVENRIQAALPAIIKAVKLEIELQIGERDSAKTAPYVETIVHAVANGQPFPLRYEIDRRVVVFKDIRVEDGRLTLVLAPPEPANVVPR